MKVFGLKTEGLRSRRTKNMIKTDAKRTSERLKIKQKTLLRILRTDHENRSQKIHKNYRGGVSAPNALVLGLDVG